MGRLLFLVFCFYLCAMQCNCIVPQRAAQRGRERHAVVAQRGGRRAGRAPQGAGAAPAQPPAAVPAAGP